MMGIPTPERHSLAHRAYGYLGLLIFGVVNLIFFSTISDIITPLWTSLAFLCATIKSLHFYYHRAEAWALIGHLDTFYMENNLECALMAKYIRGMKYLSVVCSLITIAAMNLYALMMVLLNVEPVLAYPAWLPFLDWKNNARDYWIATVFTHVSVHYDVLLLLPIEFLMSFLMCIISLQIEIIGQRLAVIGFSAERTTANLHESTEKLIQCIRLHRDAFQFKHSVCNLFSLPWTIQLFCSTLVISAVVTEVTKVLSIVINPKLLKRRKTCLLLSAGELLVDHFNEQFLCANFHSVLLWNENLCEK